MHGPDGDPLEGAPQAPAGLPHTHQRSRGKEKHGVHSLVNLSAEGMYTCKRARVYALLTKTIAQGNVSIKGFTMYEYYERVPSVYRKLSDFTVT